MTAGFSTEAENERAAQNDIETIYCQQQQQQHEMRHYTKLLLVIRYLQRSTACGQQVLLMPLRSLAKLQFEFMCIYCVT